MSPDNVFATINDNQVNVKDISYCIIQVIRNFKIQFNLIKYYSW